MGVAKEEIFAAFARYVSPGKVRFFREHGIDFAFGRREGPFIWDVDGKNRLIDCHCNGGVFNLGHRNPEIIATLTRALAEVDIGNHHFVSEYRARVAEKMARLVPGALQHTIFAVSGGEAVDTAIKIARGATGRKKIISAQGGYHGHTGLAMAAGDAKYSRPFLSESEDFVQVPFGDPGSLNLDSGVAAVILETIPATLGMPVASEAYFGEVKKRCRDNGSVFIADEVQTGLGRTGKFWAIEHWGVAPDILVAGKGLSGGIYPIAATVISPELGKIFHEDPFIHISTFGGSELGCAVCEKVLDMSSAGEFLSHVNSLAETFRAGLGELQRHYAPLFPEFRQKGLMMGLKTASAELGPLLCKTCMEAGLLCVFAGNDPSVLQFLPPLVIEPHLAHEILQRMAGAMESAARFI